MKARLFRALIALLCCAVLGPTPARADCTNPAGAEGQSTYNLTYHVPQFCDGTKWIAYGELNPAAGGSGCTNPTKPEGAVEYNTAFHTMQFCNGTNWMAVGGSCKLTVATGYFVLTKTAYAGNAVTSLPAWDSLCATELTSTSTGWKGYSASIDPKKIRAFVCFDNGCNELLPNTTYYFANANDSTAGGASFTTDNYGAGPNDAANWSDVTHFNISAQYWAGRGAYVGTNTAWDYGASNWGMNNGSSSGTGVSNATDMTRWGVNGGTSYSSLPILCYVNP